MAGQSDSNELDEALRALSHPTRRAMVRLTTGRQVPATELAELLEIAPATASEHLRVLRKTGLVELSATGTWRRYQANRARIEAVLDALAQDIFRSPPRSRKRPQDSTAK